MSHTYANAQTTPPLTIDDVRAIRQRLEAYANRPEPLGEWMRQKGFPPESCSLILPPSMRPALSMLAMPHYAWFSELVATPTLIRRP